MKNNTIYKLIQNEEAKDFINKIPESLSSKCKIIKIEKARLITIKGDTIEKIHINIEGKMQVKNEFENGFIYSFAEVDSIAYIGAMEIMASESKYSSTLETTTDCIMIEMNVNDFVTWINKDPKLTLQVLKFVSKSMYKQSLHKGEVLAYPAIYSLISYLITMYEKNNNDILYLEKSREEIGSILGFSIRTVNRNLKILKDKDLISVNRKKISINKEQLNKLNNMLNSIKIK